MTDSRDYCPLPALVVLEGGVGLHVGPQVGPVSETLATVSTPKRLVASVRPQVTLQQPGSGEGLPTDVALVVEVVGEDVHGEGGHADVHLPAHPALLGRAGAQAQVGLLVPDHCLHYLMGSIFLLLVPGQVAAGGVVLAALRALVLGLVHIEQAGRVLAPPVAGEEGLVGVGGGLPVIEREDSVRLDPRLRGDGGPACPGGGG